VDVCIDIFLIIYTLKLMHWSGKGFHSSDVGVMQFWMLLFLQLVSVSTPWYFNLHLRYYLAVEIHYGWWCWLLMRHLSELQLTRY